MKSQKIWATLDPFYEEGEIMGRSVANKAFLRALLTADPYDAYHFFLRDAQLQERVRAGLHKDFPAIADAGRFVFLPRMELPRALAETPYHCFHLSDCINNPAHLARLRNAVSPGIFPITGTTHSLSYTQYSRDFLAHVWPGATRRDCVLATSSTAVGVVEGYYDFLAEGYGLQDTPRPRVEVIPLGVDTDAMQPPTDGQRTRARAALGLEPDDRMLLVFARLSHHSKMDLLPVLRAVQRLKEHGVDVARVHLVLAGWMEEKGAFASMFKDLAANIGLDCRLVPRPDEDAKRDLYHAADIFLSPVDNPQETFGLTMLEAAAYGLPVVASRYDGYRDLVVHGETGLLVPVTGPDDTRAIDCLAPLVFDTEYHLLMAQQTAVDVPSLARALATLIQDPEAAAAMGRKARKRVESDFTWQRVVQMHVELWDALWDEDLDPDPLRRIVHPLHTPYSRVFGGYPARTFDPAMELVWSRAGEAVYREQEFVTFYEGLAAWMTPETLRKLLFFARKPRTAKVLMDGAARVADLTLDEARFFTLWALKYDLLEEVHTGEGHGER